MHVNVKPGNLLGSCEFIDGLATARFVCRTIGDVTGTAACWARYASGCNSRSVTQVLELEDSLNRSRAVSVLPHFS